MFLSWKSEISDASINSGVYEGAGYSYSEIVIILFKIIFNSNNSDGRKSRRKGINKGPAI